MVPTQTWKGKELVVDNYRNADKEMLECDITIDDVIWVMENGSEVKKRKKGFTEKWCHRGKHILIVMVEDRVEYWLIGHVGKIKATKDKMKILRGGK
ncbi:MAG: hypothetical protein QF682_03390 [Candidatus Thermoplasmatota archaeon]|nr:hypothetical protein [Candidatus Thermoplasmatota archaeon]